MILVEQGYKSYHCPDITKGDTAVRCIAAEVRTTTAATVVFCRTKVKVLVIRDKVAVISALSCVFAPTGSRGRLRCTQKGFH